MQRREQFLADRADTSKKPEVLAERVLSDIDRVPRESHMRPQLHASLRGRMDKIGKDLDHEFNPRRNQSIHKRNAIEGLIAYLFGVHVYNQYLADGVVIAAGAAATIMSFLAPVLFPFFIGYAGSRTFSSLSATGFVGWAATMLCGLAGFVTLFSPLMALGGLVALSAPPLITGVSMIVGALAGWRTRHI